MNDSQGSFEDAFARYVDRLNAGEGLDKERIRAENPDIADRLLEELEAYEIFGGALEAEAPLGTLGDYTLRRQIGRGGMGVVYEAWENSMDRQVALKVLPAGIAADDKSVTRFVREARLAGKLNHPNVVGVYGMGVKEQTPYYAMEFVEGETLAQLLDKLKTAQPEAETPFGKKDDARFFLNLAEAFADVSDGLQHAHAKGIIHRDIKPSNLILDGEGRLRILDFGLARLEGQESLTASGDFLGTPLYMSPEQARRKKIPIDHRTDVYSVGATLYELLTLRPPFQGKDHNDTLSQIIDRDPVEPRKLNPRIPRDLETIVLKCLRKEPADRYGTAEALGQDLRRFVRGDPIEARTQARWERALVRMRRQWRSVTVGIAFVGLVMAAAVLLLALWSRQKEERWARYCQLVDEGIIGLELGLLAVSGDDYEGEALSLGLVLPDDLGRRDEPRKGSLERAIALLRTARDLQPAHPEARVHLARGLLAQGKKAEARSEIDHALRRAPRFIPAILHGLHPWYGGSGMGEDTEKALEALQEGFEARWEKDLLASHRASLKGDWAEVRRIYSDLLKMVDPPPFAGFATEIRIKRGRVALRTKD